MYKITTQDIKYLLEYLASRPYAEVYQWIALLQWLEEIKEEKKEEKPNKK